MELGLRVISDLGRLTKLLMASENLHPVMLGILKYTLGHNSNIIILKI